MEFLNEVLDEGLSLHPLKEQRESVRDWRQIGLGIMGLADMLIKLGITYGSKESVEICDKIGSIMNEAGISHSIALAIREKSFAKCDNEKTANSSFIKANGSIYIDDILKYGMRNSQLFTIAPTGTLSTMLGISGGIEPIFANSYNRTTKSLYGEDVVYKIYTPIVDKYMKINGINDEKDLPEYFVTSETINYKNRVAMQAIWQKHIDASISSTVNLPESATIDDVYDLYLSAWKAGLKGITIFRSGCKRTAILDTNSNAPAKIKAAPDTLIGRKKKLTTGCGSLHCTAFFDPNDGKIMEVYLNKGSSGGCNNFMIGLSRMISLSLRGDISLDDIVDQLNSSGVCPSYAVRSATKKDTSLGSSCPVAIGNALKEMQEEVFHMLNKSTTTEKVEQHTDAPKCPSCGEDLIHEGGCDICKACGWSKCS